MYAMSQVGHDLFDFGVKCLDCEKIPSVETYSEVENHVSHDLFDYSNCNPTVDQLELNAWLAAQDLEYKNILHLGIGNSSLAGLVLEHVNSIVGFTVAENELSHALGMKSERYEAHLINKYSPEFRLALRGRKFDYIVDNNLASFVCCQKHFMEYFSCLIESLNHGGIIVTHWLGMQWVLDLGINDTETAWLLDGEKLSRIAKYYGMRVKTVGDIYLIFSD